MYTGKGTILWLLEGVCEREWHFSETGEDIDTRNLIEKGNLEITPELESEWERFEKAVDVVLKKCDLNTYHFHIYDAAYNIFMTLNGEGVGIWDGRWDNLLTEKQLKNLEQCIKNDLSSFANDCGGGSLNEAFSSACYIKN